MMVCLSLAGGANCNVPDTWTPSCTSRCLQLLDAEPLHRQRSLVSSPKVDLGVPHSQWVWVK